LTPPLNILFLNHVGTVGSGAEASLTELVGAIDREKFRCVVGLPDGPLADRLAAGRVATVRIPMRRLRRRGHPGRLARAAASVARCAPRIRRTVAEHRIDVIHANSDTAQVYAAAASYLVNCPVVWHSRDLADLGTAGRWMARRASRIVAISEAVASHFVKCGVEPRLNTTIPNGIDLARFAPRGEGGATRARLGIPAGAPVVGMVGHLVRWKNHAGFLQAAGRVAPSRPDTRWLIVGEDLFADNPHYGHELVALAASLGIGDRVIFTGFCEDILPVLEAMDVLVHPAECEPFGRAVVEGMALAKPVVAVNACGPAEIICDGVDGILVPPGDTVALAAAVNGLLADPVERQRLGGNARGRTMRDFDIRRVARAVEKLHQQLVARAGTSQ